ncbi:dipicolinate synthase subunit DpsA [Dactylosporangium sp. CA-233914]|uniref:dipicolinate synthase subunit DpsA n=1 Tax=Dactylosporangium sp. CA-233914 TaxID=3239934 RepID=UPI003D8F6F2B
MNWQDLVIAVVGGDEREQEISRLAARTGATVRTFGIPEPDAPIDGVAPAGTLAAAIADATHLLLPIPGMSQDGSIYAPAAAQPIHIDVHVLKSMRAPRLVILGAADDRLRTAAAAGGATLYEYEQNQELMLLRTPAIVEGAIRAAVEATRFTIDANRAVVVGFGNIGARLAVTLAALGARVTVVARNPVQRAAARAAHLDAAPLDQLDTVTEDAPMLFSTVPAPVVGPHTLARLAPRALVMDLAAPPGGVDLAAARELGHNAVWARGLGRRAPVTVGASQWGGIRHMIERTGGDPR